MHQFGSVYLGKCYSVGKYVRLLNSYVTVISSVIPGENLSCYVGNAYFFITLFILFLTLRQVTEELKILRFFFQKKVLNACYSA